MISGNADDSVLKPKKKTGRTIQSLRPSLGSIMPDQWPRNSECECCNLVTHLPDFGCHLSTPLLPSLCNRPRQTGRRAHSLRHCTPILIRKTDARA